MTTFVACSPSVSDVEEQLSGDDIINGQVTSDYPAVVQLRMPGWVCSGTIINGDRVLTAAHCLVDTDGTSVSSVRIVGGATADAWEAHPDYDPSNFFEGGAGYDLGVVHFPTGLGAGLAIGGAPAVGSDVRLVGYGLYSLNEGIDGQKRTAINRVQAVSGNYFQHRGTNNVCSGDSGGAVLSVDGQQIFGVISRGETGCSGNSYAGIPSASAAWLAGAPGSSNTNPGGDNGDNGGGDTGGTPGAPDYPVFTGGHVDPVGGPNEVHGWCAVVKGSTKQSTEVRVLRDDVFIESIQATEVRSDVSDHIEAWYAAQGHADVQMPDDTFGFKYTLTLAGRYTFTCADLVIGEKTLAPSKYPIFSAGHVDPVGGPNEVNGWCAVVNGPVKQSTEVRVFRNGTFREAIQATERRSDVSEHIEAWYREQGLPVEMPDDIFGFKYDLAEDGRYEFQCANTVIGEKTRLGADLGTDYPIFAGGHVDNVGGPNEVNGWCAIVKGPVVQSTEVRVLRDGVFQSNIYATEARGDVRDHIEAWYATNGYDGVSLPNDTFGFKYTLTTPGRYEFRCANAVIGEKTLAAPELPVFSGGNVDPVGGPDEVHGWCATVRGSTVQSTEVTVTRNGIFVGTVRASANRSDVSDHIEAWYQSQGYTVQMPNDRFGFYYQLTGPGRYEFTCANAKIGEKTLTPPDYPIFAGGNVDPVGGPNEVHGWCAIVKGPVVQSTEVRVLRDGVFQRNIYASARRGDVSDYIEDWYATRGYSGVIMPTNVFGFYYTLPQSGTYTFQCAGTTIGTKTL
ncbi:MAG: trypsin-like serine protease [Deltaproteobacteria bacterium]|nr:trypsin-like serine protease [Deltaproteobacteria bacterium]